MVRRSWKISKKDGIDLEEKERKEIIEGLSDIERELYLLVQVSLVLSLDFLRGLNPKFLGAVGKLKSRGLIELKKEYCPGKWTGRKKFIRYIPTLEEGKKETKAQIKENKEINEGL